MGAAPDEPDSRSRVAARLELLAAGHRKDASCGGSNAAGSVEEADRLDVQVAALHIPEAPPTLKCGEVARSADENSPPWEITNTLHKPDQIAIDASATRTALLYDQPADLVAIAIDAAASVKAGNSLEKMLAHQLGGLHVLMMKSMKRALQFEKREGAYGEGFKRDDAIEFGRLCNSASRLSSAFQEGLLTLQRIKSGASQTVTVRHVTIAPGGQAVFGNVKTGAKRKSKAAGGKRPE